MGARAKEPLLFCFCGPGASGKSTICRELARSSELNLFLSISTTSRKPRGKEADGVEYHFVAEAEFLKRVRDRKFIEHAEFGGSYYGTETKNIQDASSRGADLLLDIDVQGAKLLRAQFRERVVVVFVFPPSIKILEERFRARGTDSEERIQERLRIAEREVAALSTPDFSDYLVVNDILAEAVSLSASIVEAERARFSRLNEAELRAIFER